MPPITDSQAHIGTDLQVPPEQATATDAIAQADVLQLSIADQWSFANALLNPANPVLALGRAFARRKKYIENAL